MNDLFRIWDRTSFHLNRKFYFICFGASVLFVLGYFLPFLFNAAVLVLCCLGIATLVDVVLLYRKRQPMQVLRLMQDRLSNGDPNRVVLELANDFDFKVKVEIIDELPYQFRQTSWKKTVYPEQGKDNRYEYFLQPTERGEYVFGDVNLYVSSPLDLVKRRLIIPQERTVKVYPSFIQMRRFQIIAVASHAQPSGVKRMRRLGHSMEFEQIKEYVRGDDYRTLNWKATARRGDFMVNSFTDERSQQIYCLVNKGRAMKMPFDGMSLLDHAINASLVISSVALQKQDKAGLITFSQQLDAFIPADKKPTQINQILETLYRQETNFQDPDFEKLFSVVRNRISHRSLLVLFTNFESYESLLRELPTLKRLAHYHLLMVVFFENTEIRQLTETKPSNTEEIYIRTIAEKYRHEKRLIAKELQANGIIAVLTPPQHLTINTLNKYLELKNRQSI